MAWNSAITNIGRTLLQQWTTTGETLTITQATGGTGTVSVANLAAQTSISGSIGALNIASVQQITAGTQYAIQVQPAQQTAYTLRQVGLWAQLGSEGINTLLAIYQNEDGISVPTASTSPGFIYTLYATVVISNSGQIKVVFTPGTYLTRGDLPLSVPNGGTGTTSLTSGRALIGNGTGAVQTRTIQNMTAQGEASSGNSLITANTLINHVGYVAAQYLPLAGGRMTGSLNTPTPLNITSPSGATRSEINFGRAGENDVPNKRAGVLRYDLSSNQWKFLHVTSDNSVLESFYLPATDLAATSGSSYSIFTAKDNARTGFYSLASGGNKCTLTLNNNVGMFAISRAGTSSNPSARCVCVAEYWSGAIGVFGELPSQIVLQKSSNSNVITIQNNRTTGVALTCVSGIFAAVDGTDAITQTATLINYSYYVPGDTYKITGPLGLDGYITSDAKGINFTVIVEKNLGYINMVTVTALTGVMRGVNGAIANSTTSTNWLTQSGVTVTASVNGPNVIRISMAFDSVPNNATANTIANLAASLTLSFS